MMKGIKLKIITKESNILMKILVGIEFADYFFDVNNFESYEMNMDDNWKELSNDDTIKSEDAKERILTIDDSRAKIEFLELNIRYKGSKKADLYDYNDFLDSDYETVIKLIDACIIHIYSKNQEFLKKVLSNLRDYNNSIKFKNLVTLDQISIDEKMVIWYQKSEIPKSNLQRY